MNDLIEKVKQGLRCIAQIGECDCDHCDYADNGHPSVLYKCQEKFASDGLSVIEFQQAEIEQTHQKWIPADEQKPDKHEMVILTGIEAINNKRVYDIKCWDRDTWRPCNSAPSIFWDYWHKLPKPPEKEDDKNG